MITEVRTRLVFVCISFSLIVFLAFSTESFGEEPTLSKGQTLWVPVYSHFTSEVVAQQGVFSREIKMKEVNRQLTTNVAIHNTDLNHPITIVKADYYDANGKLLKSFVSGPLKIKPMAATYFFIKMQDQSEGWGAKVLIRWQSESLVNEPIVESVTVGLGTHSISITSKGKPIRE